MYIMLIISTLRQESDSWRRTLRIRTSSKVLWANRNQKVSQEEMDCQGWLVCTALEEP